MGYDTTDPTIYRQRDNSCTTVTFKFNHAYLDAIDAIVERERKYATRSHFIREAIRKLAWSELENTPTLEKWKDILRYAEAIRYLTPKTLGKIRDRIKDVPYCTAKHLVELLEWKDNNKNRTMAGLALKYLGWKTKRKTGPQRTWFPQNEERNEE